MWFCSFLEKNIPTHKPLAFVNFANKTKGFEPCSSSCVTLLYIYASNKKRGLHKYSRDTPPPAWYSKRFVDKVNKRY